MTSIGSLYAPPAPVSHVVNSVVAYTGLTVDRPAYKHFEDNKLEPFLKDFPHGQIPAFKSKSGLSIFEGAAIARYIAALAPESGLIPSTLEEKAQVDQWSHLIEAEIRTYAIQNWLIITNRLGPFVQEYSDLFKKREERALNTVNQHLNGRTYLVGDKITLADIELASSIRFSILHTFDKAQREKYANIFNHFERLAKLPSLEPILGGATYVEESIKNEQPKA